MESILVILCIVFFLIFTHGFVEYGNSNKFHTYNCHTIYIPEDLDLETTFKFVNSLSHDGLKKRARYMGATKQFADTAKIKELKAYIIQNSLTDEHILFTDITEDIELRENIEKRELCREKRRDGEDVPNSCPTAGSKLDIYTDLNIPILKNNYSYPVITSEDIINNMKLEVEELENKLYSFE